VREKTLLLVEDNPVDEALTLRALEKHNVGERIVVVRDGATAIEYLLGKGLYWLLVNEPPPVL
jgi:two-component system, response regulator